MSREFKQITQKERKYYHPLQHKIKAKHRLAKRTIFFMKEYGPHSHVASNIIKESMKIVLLTSLISSFGGVALETIRPSLLLPLLIIVPAITHMVGSFGTIVASKFTTALFMGRVRGEWWHLHFLHRLFMMVFAAALLSALYMASLAIIVSLLLGFVADLAVYKKLIFITLTASVVLVGLIFNISVVGGLWIYKRGEDPNNFLIPITTALADFGSLIIFSYLVTLFF